MNKALLFTLAVCLLCAVKSNLDIENILFRLSYVTISGTVIENYEKQNSDIRVLIHFNPILRVDPTENLIHIYYPDGKVYKNEFDDLCSQIDHFSVLGFKSVVKFSLENTKMHLNFDFEVNKGYFVKEVNLIEDASTGDKSVQVRLEEALFGKKSMIFKFDFESLRVASEIQMLVDYFNSIKQKDPHPHHNLK